MLEKHRLSKCYICGATPTVKSHILPRALSHQIRRNDKHVVVADPAKNNITFHQSGRWDDRLLCHAHESALGPYDDYGVRFIRSVLKKIRPGENQAFPNSQPDKLKKFALAVIWRADLSRVASGLSSQLGIYQKLIPNTLFHDHSIAAAVYLIQNNVTANGEPLEIAAEPTPIQLGDSNAWKFGVGRLDFVVRLGRRNVPMHWKEADAGAHSSPLVLSSEPTEITRAPAYRPLLEQVWGTKPGR